MILNLAFAVGKETMKITIARMIAREAVLMTASAAIKEITKRIKNGKK